MSEKPTYDELEKTVQKMQTAEALHKHELKALHKSENRYRTILQTAIDGFWITDINGHFLEVNLAYAQMSGYSQDELLTMQISDIEANEDPVAVKEHIKSGLKKGYGHFQSLHRRKDNSIYPVEVNFTYLDEETTKFVVFIKDISERKEAESKLLKNQYYLTKAQEIAKIGTWELDIQKNKILWTDENYKIFGVPLGTKLNYEIFLSIVHPDDKEYVDRKWNEALKGKPYDIIHRIVAENTIKWVREKADIQFDSKGNLVMAIGFTQDLTDLKQVESALQESENKFRDMFERAPLSYQSLDERGNFIDVNQTWLRTMGYTREEVLGKNFSEFLVPEWKSHFKVNFPRFKAIGEILGVEFEMVKKDGSTILVSFHGKIGKNQQGDFQQTHCIFQDISERKQAEEESNRLKERLQSLWNVAKISDSDIETISDHVLAEAQKITQSHYAFFGLLSEDKNKMILHAWSHETMEECKTSKKNLHFPIEEAGLWAEAIRKKKILTINDFSCDDPKKKGLPEGHVPLTRLMVVPCIKEDKVISVVAVANKKTDYLAEDEEQVLAFLNNVQLLIDKKAAEQEAAEMATQLHQAQKIEAIGRLAGGVAHDFNNMLSVITGYAEMALEETLPSQPIYEKLEKIKEAGERSADLTRQLLAFARKQNISPKVLDCNEVIENMTSMLNRLVGEHIDLIWQPDKKIWPAKIDRSQIEQILANLCVNAKDAIADLGKIIIETGNATFDQDYCNAHPECIPGEYIMLAISDDGHGMDSGTLENIFEPFYTTKGPGEGTGLGLATVYGVVRQNQGFVNVYSEPGQGTTFKIYLPRFKTKSGSMPEESGKKSIEVGHETILLVEDEVAILEMAEQMLNRLGYRVITAKTPGEAIRLAQEHFGEIQLLLSDVIMPEMNGRDLAKNILSVYPNVKRLFMSGYTANIIAHHGVLDEGINFIQKPFSSHELGTKIREVLDKDKS